MRVGEFSAARNITNRLKDVRWSTPMPFYRGLRPPCTLACTPLHSKTCLWNKMQCRFFHRQQSDHLLFHLSRYKAVQTVSNTYVRWRSAFGLSPLPASSLYIHSPHLFCTRHSVAYMCRSVFKQSVHVFTVYMRDCHHNQNKTGQKFRTS